MAKLRRYKSNISQIVSLESEIVKLKREMHIELDKIGTVGNVIIVSTE